MLRVYIVTKNKVVDAGITIQIGNDMELGRNMVVCPLLFAE